MQTHANCVGALAAIVALLALAFAARGADTADLRSGVFNPPRPAPDFSLRGSDGAELKLSRYRGKVVALGFGYTSCPDVCPTTLFFLAQAREKLGAAGKDFQVVYVTVDPERDNAERLRSYLAAFDPTFLGGTGTPEQLAEVRKAYGIQVSKTEARRRSQAGYFVHHSSFVYLIDRAGNMRAMMPFGVSADDIAHDVKDPGGKLRARCRTWRTAIVFGTVAGSRRGDVARAGRSAQRSVWKVHGRVARRCWGAREAPSGTGNGAVYGVLANAGKRSPMRWSLRMTDAARHRGDPRELSGCRYGEDAPDPQDRPAGA